MQDEGNACFAMQFRFSVVVFGCHPLRWIGTQTVLGHCRRCRHLHRHNWISQHHCRIRIPRQCRWVGRPFHCRTSFSPRWQSFVSWSLTRWFARPDEWHCSHCLANYSKRRCWSSENDRDAASAPHLSCVMGSMIVCFAIRKPTDSTVAHWRRTSANRSIYCIRLCDHRAVWCWLSPLCSLLRCLVELVGFLIFAHIWRINAERPPSDGARAALRWSGGNRLLWDRCIDRCWSARSVRLRRQQRSARWPVEGHPHWSISTPATHNQHQNNGDNISTGWEREYNSNTNMDASKRVFGFGVFFLQCLCEWNMSTL